MKGKPTCDCRKNRAVTYAILGLSLVSHLALLTYIGVSARPEALTSPPSKAASQAEIVGESDKFYVVKRPVRSTVTKTIPYTVKVPIRERRSKTIKYTVRKPVQEQRTRIDEKSGEEIQYNVTRFVSEVKEKTVHFNVCRFAEEQREKTVQYTVTRFENVEIPKL